MGSVVEAINTLKISTHYQSREKIKRQFSSHQSLISLRSKINNASFYIRQRRVKISLPYPIKNKAFVQFIAEDTKKKKLGTVKN
jgi:hypothetical protein